MTASEPTDNQDTPETNWSPEEFATEMLDGYFARPVVVAALVTKGMDAEVAREIVVKLQKERYLKIDVEKKAERKLLSRWLIGTGAALLLISIGASLYSSSRIISRDGGGFVVYWGPICMGIVILLYGFSKRKHV